MYGFLMAILILVCIVLVGAVLLQAGKGGGVAASFGGASSSADAYIGTRQAGNLLTKTSWIGGGVFLGLAFILQLMSTRSRVPTSVLDAPIGATAPAAATPAPATGAAPSSAVPLQTLPATPAPATPAPQP